MRAVNLIPADARRGRGGGAGIGPGISAGTLGPAHFLVALLVIVVALIVLRVLADNNVNNKKATLATVQAQVTQEQAEASKLSVYTSFVQAAQQREDTVREVAEQRFPWKRTFDQLGHVLPATTSLTSLSATTGASSAAGSTTGATSSTTTAAAGPTFTLAGCADTPNQNGVATLLRRLTQLTGVTNVGFQNSTRATCGNNFNIVLNFRGPGGSTAAAGSTSAVPAPTTTTGTTTTTTASTGTTSG